MNRMASAEKQLPDYAVFDDYRYNQRIAVVVRWFLLVIWLFLHNYKGNFDDPQFWTNNSFAAALSAVNAYVHWRIWKGRPITRGYALTISIADVTFISVGVALSEAFANTFFVLLYPALVALSLVAWLKRLAFGITAVVAAAYAWMSFTIEPVIDFDKDQEKVLAIRIACMFAVVAAGHLITRIERRRRMDAVEAEHARAEENLDLQIKAQEAERAKELAKANERLLQELNERKRAEQALERRTTELAALNDELEAFSYSVSHDLRAPLRSIDKFSEAVLEDHAADLDADGQDYLNRVRAASGRMEALIDDLLTLSRITSSELQREEVDLSAMAKVVTTELQNAQPEREAEFVVEPGVVAEADPHLVRVALDNLMANAWKFTGQQEKARIEFGSAQSDGEQAYFVRDDGVGFDDQFSDKLFVAFQRLHSADFEGTGIGLATVQRIINRHGGRVWAESDVGHGATFYFTLG